MHLNKLREIKQIKGEKFKFSAIGQDDSDFDGFSDNEDDSTKDGDR
jgi:hypothetical protein